MGRPRSRRARREQAVPVHEQSDPRRACRKRDAGLPGEVVVVVVGLEYGLSIVEYGLSIVEDGSRSSTSPISHLPTLPPSHLSASPHPTRPPLRASGQEWRGEDHLAATDIVGRPPGLPAASEGCVGCARAERGLDHADRYGRRKGLGRVGQPLRRPATPPPRRPAIVPNGHPATQPHPSATSEALEEVLERAFRPRERDLHEEAAALESELEEFEPEDDHAVTIAQRLGEIDDELEELSGDRIVENAREVLKG